MSVYFSQCPSYQEPTLSAALESLLQPLGGMAALVRPGQTVLIKPNLLSADAPEKRVTTDPALVRGVALAAQRAGGRVIIGDSPALDGFSKVAQRTGMLQIAQELGCDLRALDQPAHAPAPAGWRFKNLEIARLALEADVVINLPKLKTHCQMVLTLGVKNLFGTVVGMRKAEWHHMAGNNPLVFAGLLLQIAQTVKPGLTILDGVWGMEGHGPSNGAPRFFGLLAASANPLLLDLNLANWLGLSWGNFPLAQAAHGLGLIPQPWPEAAWLGQPLPALSNVDLPLPQSLRFLPGFLEGLTRRYVVSRPAQDRRRCVLCGKCMQICPEKCIHRQGNALRFDYRRCIRCYCCQEVCPVNAIALQPGFLAKTMRALGR